MPKGFHNVPKTVAPEIAPLFLELRKNLSSKVEGFPNFPANLLQNEVIAEAIEELGITYRPDEQRFYIPYEVEGRIAEKPVEVVSAVGSYLLSTFDEEYEQDARFLPDPSEPTTDLEELAKEEARLKALAQERSEKIESFIHATKDPFTAKQAVLDYFSMLEQQISGLAVPINGDVAEKVAYVDKLFEAVVQVRGSSSLADYLHDLHRLASEGVAEVTRAFAEAAPTLYRQLSAKDAQDFVDIGLAALKQYKDDSTRKGKQKKEKVLEEAVAYFSLQSPSASNVITTKTLAEHGWLLPAYAALKQDLGRAEEKAESLRKALEENLRKNTELSAERDDLNFKLQTEKNIVVVAHDRADDVARRYADLDKKHTQDASDLEKERYKSARLEDLERGKDTAYQTATQRAKNLEGELAAVKATLVDTKTELRKMGRWSGLTGLAVGALCALVVTSYDFSSKAPTPSKSVPAATTSAVPVPAPGYDPQGRNLRQLERDFYKFINQPRPAGEELPKFGPGCLNVLGQVYDRMNGVPEGKDYFLNSMTVSNFCNSIPENKLVQLGEKK